MAYDRGVADWKRGVRKVLYPAYEARMLRRMPANVPKHVGVMLDGNRRWARAVGQDTAHGHRAGAANIEPLLTWSDEVGIEVVTLWLLSTDNLTRPPEELDHLLRIIEGLVADLASAGRWQLHSAGALDMLPEQTAAALCRAETETAGVDGLVVNVAVGYGGRTPVGPNTLSTSLAYVGLDVNLGGMVYRSAETFTRAANSPFDVTPPLPSTVTP